MHTMNRIGSAPDNPSENVSYPVNAVHPVKISFFLAPLRPRSFALKPKRGSNARTPRRKGARMGQSIECAYNLQKVATSVTSLIVRYLSGNKNGNRVATNQQHSFRAGAALAIFHSTENVEEPQNTDTNAQTEPSHQRKAATVKGRKDCLGEARRVRAHGLQVWASGDCRPGPLPWNPNAPI